MAASLLTISDSEVLGGGYYNGGTLTRHFDSNGSYLHDYYGGLSLYWLIEVAKAPNGG